MSLQGRWQVALEGLQSVAAIRCRQPSGESWWLCKPVALVTLARHVARACHRGVRATEDEQDVPPCLSVKELIHPSGGRAPALSLVPCLVLCQLPCPSLAPMPSSSPHSHMPLKRVSGSPGCWGRATPSCVTSMPHGCSRASVRWWGGDATDLPVGLAPEPRGPRG